MSKRQLILDTLLTMIAENGFHDSSMRDLSERSGVSIGNIYNYFSGKEELIKSLYYEWQAKRVGSIMDRIEEANASEEVVKEAWSGLFEFYTNHISAFHFIEQFVHSPFYGDEERKDDKRLMEPLISKLEKGIARGELRYMNPLGMSYILMGHASSAARLHLEGKVNIKDYQRDVVRQSCWDSLRPMKY